MTVKTCKKCGNYTICAYYLGCVDNASNASKCSGFFIEKPVEKIDTDFSNIKKQEGVSSVRKPKTSCNKIERMERGLPFLL